MWELLLTCLTQNNEQGLTTAPGLIFPFSAYFSSIDTRQSLQLHSVLSLSQVWPDRDTQGGGLYDADTDI